VQKFVNPRALVATAVALALQGIAFAADTATGVAAPAAEAADEVHTLVVTARRRSEDVQDVPVAVSVLDAATLESTGSFNVARLQQLQPSLQFFSTNARNSAANIRGLGAPFGLTNDGIEQGVGLYVDDVYYARAAASTFDFLDVERLEVLRGPQGTLYGKNTTAGTINITTRAPTFTPEGNAEISFGNLGLLQTKAAISGPILGDTLAGRLAVSSTNRHGTIYNVKSTNLVNEIDNFGIRGQILWRVNDALDVTFAGDYNVQDPECCAQIFVRVGTTQRPLNRQYWALAALQNYAPPSTDPFDRVTDLDAELRARNELGGTSIRAVWDLGAGTFTSVTSWRYWDWTPANDRDFTGLPIALKVNNPTRQDQATQEFRYAYTGDRIDYVVGLFGYNQSVRTYGIQVQGPAASRWLLNPTSAASLNPATLNNLTSNNDIDLDNTSVALFGQLTWRLTDKLRFEPGLRLNHDSKDGSYISTVTNGTNTALTADQRGVLAPQSYTAKFSDWNVSGDAKFSYAFTPDVLGYVSYARSFKTGGINLNGLPLDGANNPILAAATIRPEKINHYEAGLKTQFLNRTATLNVTGFWTDIDDFQTTVTNGQFAVVRGYLANAEKVRVRGVETEFSINPTDRFSAYVNAAFTDHEYVRFVDAPCPPELSGGTTATGSQVPGAAGTPGALSPANCNISGQWLPGISKWALSYGTQYEFPGATLLGREGKAYVGFDGSYRSRYSSNASRSAYTDISGYALANVRVGFRGESGWDVYGWVRNALDRDYFEVLATTPGNTGLISGQPADPRTYGVTVRVDF
jgi:iron complex outermembrane receptor protein